jgi:spermidine/putrescine transport system permease protein
MAQDWKQHKRPFAAIAGAPLFWLLLFFLMPMAIVWLYSFGENAGPADIAISGTLENYKRATEWLYLSIFLKSLAVAALVTLICLIIGFPVAMAITFASAKWRPWLLLGIMLPFWTNLLIRTYALMMLMGTNGYANKGLGALWEGASWLRTLSGCSRWRHGRRCSCSTTISPWCSGWSMSICPSWFCRSMPRSTGSTNR